LGHSFTHDIEVASLLWRGHISDAPPLATKFTLTLVVMKEYWEWNNKLNDHHIDLRLNNGINKGNIIENENSISRHHENKNRFEGLSHVLLLATASAVRLRFVQEASWSSSTPHPALIACVLTKPHYSGT
jgi:hypothetical protein